VTSLQAKRDELERKTLRLIKPISLGSQVIDELAFREPMAKDLRDLPKDEVSQVLLLAGRLTGQTSQVLDRLGIEDFLAVGEVVQGFLPGGLSTGGEA